MCSILKKKKKKIGIENSNNITHKGKRKCERGKGRNRGDIYLSDHFAFDIM